MSYLDSTINYIKVSIESIKTGFLTIKDILTSIANILGTIIEILGFIGFRVLLLLIITAFIAWILNLVSPISKKTNYFIAVGIVLWIGLTAKLPIQIVILKYILIILSPFVITKVANFIIKNFQKFLKIMFYYFKKFLSLLSEKIKKNGLKLKENSKIGVVFDEALPTLDEIENCKNVIKLQEYQPIILKSKNISLVDKNKKIIFSRDLQVEQFVNSLNEKDIDVLIFWGNSFKENYLINILNNKYNFKKQKKLIIGNNFNSKLFNFLQTKWNWKVFYGINAKNLNNFEKIEKIINNKEKFNLTIINNFNIDSNYFFKKIVVGGNLQSIIDSIGTISELNFKNKILFFNYSNDSKIGFYKNIIHLANFIIDNNIIPAAVILGKISDTFDYSKIIAEFDLLLKNKNINIPIFQSNINYLLLNEKYIIKNNMDNIVFY